MSDNKIYEIAQMMQDKSVLEGDLNEAASLVTKMFQEKYINRIHNAIQETHMSCCANPPKEVHLLNALKPFMPAEGHGQMDQVIDMMLFMNTMNNIKNDMDAVLPKVSMTSVPNPESEETAIHDDGIYEIDSKCMLNKNTPANELMPIFLLMAFQGIFK